MKEARQASLVHLAHDALPDLPTEAKAYIQRIEDTATAVKHLAHDYDTLDTYVHSVGHVMFIE